MKTAWTSALSGCPLQCLRRSCSSNQCALSGRRNRDVMRPVARQPFKPRTTEELMALLSAVATAILAVIIISMLYFGRDIFVPVALAVLLSFVLAPLVG